MKKSILIIFSLIFTITTFSQEDIRVKLKDKKFYNSKATAFVVEIPQAEYKTVLKQWSKYLKNNPKEKVIIENGEIFIKNKFLPKIANDSIDIHSYIKEYAGHIVLAASFKLKGKYITDDSAEEIYYPTKNYVRQFAVQQYKKAVESELKEEQSRYAKLEQAYNALIHSNDGFQDNIKQAKQDILDNKDQITLNEMDQSSKVLQIQTQKEVVYRLVNTPGDEQKEAKKVLKKIEADFKKIQNKNSTLHNKIVNLESKIRDNKRNIENNEKEQKFLKLDKEDQEYIVRKIQKKIDRIE